MSEAETFAAVEAFGHAQIETRTVGGKTTTEQRYFASSVAVDAETLGRAARGHCGVENGLHWTPDVAFREDASRSRIGHSAASLAVVRRVSATLIQAEPTGKGGVQTRRMQAAWDGSYRAKLLRRSAEEQLEGPHHGTGKIARRRCVIRDA